MYKYLLIIFLLCGIAFSGMAQTSSPDTTKTKKDEQLLKHDSVPSKRFVPKVTKVTKEKVYHPDSTHSPHKAVIRSLMIPGYGQIYNHHWWKVPVIYATLGLLADAVAFNQRYYAPNLVVAHYYEQGVTSLPTTAKDYALWAEYQHYQVPQQTVYSLVDSYRRNRDLSIFGFVGFWGVQAIEAYIDAKFQHSYTMDTDFSFKVEPAILNQQPFYALNSGPIIPGIKLTFAFN